MNVYLAKYPAHWLGGKAVVVAEDAEQAISMIISAARKTGADVKRRNIELQPLDTTIPSCTITFSGDY